MTTAEWARLKEVFHEAVDAPPADRAAVVDLHCAGDPALRAEVLRLLNEHDSGGEFLEQPAAATAPLPTQHAGPGTRVGPFRIVSVLGTGGMGIVYEATQDNPRRTVALKVMREDSVTESSLRRFEHEAEALARLRHPGIAQIYEAGVTGDGGSRRPYFAMELARGDSLTDYAAALPIPARVELMAKVCDAVQHAHAKGVIHRDLKPANIIVDERGEPKILDFGVARLTDADLRLTIARSGVRQLVGTIPYMSPEQVAGDPASIDTRSDVYGLGVLLYELLTRRLPYDLENKSLADAALTIRDSVPARLGATTRALRGDLETIVAKALEKDPAQRYQSASGLAADLRRCLAHEPISARPHSAIYQIRTFARRNRVLVGGIAAVFLALLAGIGGTTWQAITAHRERRRAESFLDSARGAATNLANLSSDVLANIAGSSRAREQMTSASLNYFNGLAAEHIPDSEIAYHLAYAHQRAGEVHLAMGRTRQALDSYLASLRVREAQARALPNDAASLRALAVGHWMTADAFLAMARTDEAMTHNVEANRIIRDMDDRNLIESGLADPQAPGGHQWWGYLSIAHRRLGDTHLARSELSEAHANYQSAADQVRQYAPPARDHGRIEAAALLGIARVLVRTTEPTQALTTLNRLDHILADMATESGAANVWERTQQARSHILRALALASLARTEEAVDHGRRGVLLAEALATTDPHNRQSQHLLARCLLDLAHVRLAHSDSLGAAGDCVRACDLLETIICSDPDNAIARADLAEARNLLTSAAAQVPAPQ